MAVNFLLYLTAFLGGTVCFLPLPFDLAGKNLTSNRLQQQISCGSRDLSVATVALSVPIFMGVIAEIISYVLKDKKSEIVKKSGRQDLLNATERTLIAAALLISSVISFLPPETTNLANLSLCASRCRSVWTSGAITISLSRFDSKHWPVCGAFIIILLVVLANCLAAFADNIHSSERDMPIRVASYFAMYAAAVIFLKECYRYLRSVTPRLCKTLAYICGRNRDENSAERRATCSFRYLFPLFYIITTIFLVIVLVIQQWTFARVGIIAPGSTYIRDFVTYSYLFFIMFISERMMKYEVIEGLYALIESKKTYVRYISHELRTPLNTAFLGLRLVCDDLKSCSDARSAENHETLVDVQSACRTSVEILNDLLCFDKLESGILELHKHDVPVIPFIKECVDMFASQAREAGVTVTYVTTTPTSLDTNPSTSPVITTPSRSTILLNDDFVHIDKFKMDQVLRNLISNALKFTPRGGSVSVCADFVPDDLSESRGIPFSNANDRLWSLRSILSRWCPCFCLRRDQRDHRVHASRECSVFALEAGHCTPSIPSGALPQKCDDGEGDTSNPEFLSPTLCQCGSTRPYCTCIGVRNDHNSTLLGGPSTAAQDISVTGSCGQGASASDSSNLRRELTCGKLRIIVMDTGCGISEANQSKLFKEIVQFNPEVLQAGGGSGLGLWITSSIVKMHDGSITAFSDGVGRGSSFTVEIDMQRQITATDRDDRAASTPADEASPSPAHSSRLSSCSDIRSNPDAHHDIPRQSVRRCADSCLTYLPPIEERQESHATSNDPLTYDVLIVDDSSLNRKLLCKLFRASGHSCEEACDGLVAIDKVTARMARGPDLNTTYDAILMDYVMPNMDGPTATKAIRDLGYRGPIFGVTGNALGSDVNYFLSCGADAVLAKPFDFHLFKQLIEELRPV